MKIIKKIFNDALLIEPKKFHDERGFFYEHYNKKIFNNLLGKEIDFVQDNFSLSYKGVFRGIHYQKKPYAQAKLVSVSHGAVIDYIVDLREDSESYLKWKKFTLSDKNGYQLWIPEGFGHGFLAISDTVHFLYKTTEFYNKSSEECIKWNDPKIGLKFDVNFDILVSDKDQEGKLL